MKNMHEEFDKELGKRLFQYTEEPAAGLWKKVAEAIQFKEKEPLWISWSNHTATTLLVASALWMGLSSSGNYSVMGGSSDMLGGITRLDTVEASGTTSFRQPESPSVPTANPDGQNYALAVSAESTIDASSEVESEIQADLAFARKESWPIGRGYPQREILQEGGVDQGDPWNSADPAPETLAPDPALKGGSTTPLDSTMEAKPAAEVYGPLPDTIDLVFSDTDSGKGDSRKKRRRGNEFSTYFMAMPALNYQLLEVSRTDLVLIDKVNAGSSWDIGGSGFRVEWGLEIPCSKRFTAFAGLVYFHRSRTIRYTERVPGPLQAVSIPGGGIELVPQFTVQQKSFKDEVRNLGIQLGMLYKLSPNAPKVLSVEEALSSEGMKPKKRLVHWVGGGLEIQKTLADSPGNTTEVFRQPSYYAFANVYYRLQYPDVGRLKFFAQPMVGYLYVASESTDSPFQLKPLSVGFNLGCSYRVR